MVEAGTKLDREVNRLLNKEISDNPPLVLPESFGEIDLTVAPDLSSIPPLYEVFGIGRPYVVFDIREMKPYAFTSDIAEKQDVEPQPIASPLSEVIEVEQVPSGNAVLIQAGFLLLGGVDYNDIDGTAKTMRRQMQRVEQFRKITEKADRLEKDLFDGKILPEKDVEARKEIYRGRDIAASWYALELSQELLTEQMSLDLINARLPQAGPELEGAEDLLRQNDFTPSNVVSQAEKHLFSPNQKGRDAETQQLASEVKKQEEKRNPKPDKVAEGIKEAKEKYKDPLEVMRTRHGDIMWIYDPELDEPSESAATYVRNLWKIPF